MVGSSLSHYRITAELGRGGMGIVYRAEDAKLNRTVAVKILPSGALASDDDRARFYREAQAAAQLHHAHIATVFEIDEAVPEDAPHGTQPSPFIVMEYIDGETLQARVKNGPLKLPDAIRIAIETASALDAAHEKNIVHRDIKSGNIMLTKKDVAKVLDFGLAQTAQSTKLTRLGSTLGTVAYMSPEQARGEEVDGRSDLYSLGTVLYEMIAGHLPFSAEYEQAAIYSILNEDPEPLTAVRSGVPMTLEAVVMKALRKNRDLRYQTARDFIADLKAVDLSSSVVAGQRNSTIVSGTRPATPGPSVLREGRFQRMSLAGLVFTAMLLTFAAGWFLRPAPRQAASGSAVRVTESIPGMNLFSLSPDGSTIAYVAHDTLWVRRLSAESPAALTRLDQGARALFWSPNSSKVGILDGDMIRSMRPDGSNEIRVGRVPPGERIVGAVWSPEDSIYVAVAFGGANAEVVSLPAGGGSIRSTLKLRTSEGDFNISDMAWYAPTASLLAAVEQAVEGDLEASLRILNPSTEAQRIADEEFHRLSRSEIPYRSISIDPSGYILMNRAYGSGDDNLWALDLDPASMLPVSTPRIVLSGIMWASSGANGILVGEKPTATIESQIVLYDTKSEQISTVALVSDRVRFPTIKPDGSQVAFASDGTYVVDLNRGDSRRIAVAVLAISEWFPGNIGLSVSTISAEGGGADIAVVDPDGLNATKPLIAGFESEYYTDLSPDGTKLLYYVANPETGRDIWIVDVTLENDQIKLVSEPSLWFAGPLDEVQPIWHPSGKWVVYASNQSGQYEVYVREFPTARKEQRISTNGGADPAFSIDGQQIYYRDEAALYVVDILDSDTFQLSNPRVVLDFDSNRISVSGALTRSYAVHPITGEILLSQFRSEINESGLVFVSNWQALLDEK